ncbi:MAG: adenylate/guanylate cyclase domain-containing protein, partial [Thermodesulfobacteriota bacterium]|nr:adenylate/guanylate cyclase domain-containing protein [Thermodesulfobacteriota bacterium]
FLEVSELGVERVGLGELNLPTDEAGRLLVNYRGPAQTFPHYPIADILAGRLDKGTFKDKIVLVGPTAVGIYDLRVTPYDSVFPGVEIHANIIDNILHKDFLVRPNWSGIFDIGSIILIGLILGLLLPKLSAMTGPFLGLGLLAVLVGGNFAFFTRGWWINIVFPVLSLVVIYIGITVFRYITEEREKRKIKGAFSSYVNPSVVNEMLKNPDMLKLGGDKRIATVLFSDIRGFTTISEKLDPEALVNLLNRYLTIMTDLVFKYDGLLDKYIGDAIMAVWGAPLAQPEHALLACRTSLDMMAELKKLQQALAEEDENIPYLDIGIGLNTGPMVVGNMGSETRMDYTAMGDAVNLGSRLEGANKQYGTNIIIGEMTFEQVKDVMYCRELDSVAVKGKKLPVRIYEMLGETGRVSEKKINLARAFTRGLAAYKSRRFKRAEGIFMGIKEHYPEDKPTLLYLDRVAELALNPPPDDWDGVFVMTTK